MSDSITLKRCTKCSNEYPATAEYFPRRKQIKSGLQAICKTCHNQIMREYRRNNPEMIREHKRREYIKHREKHIANRRRYYVENLEIIREKERVYRQNHRSEKLARNQQYRKKNPSVHRASKLRRKARKLNLPDTFTAQHWQLCLDYWHYCCAVCGSQLRDLFGKVEPHADHWIPLSHKDCPGTTPENMICLCNRCNETKQARHPEIWLIQHAGKKKAKTILARILAYFEWIKQQG